MKQKLFTSIFVVLFLSLIYAIPGYWVFVDNNEKIHSYEEQRSLTTFPKLKYKDFRKAAKQVVEGNFPKARKEYLDDFLTRTFQKQAEKATNDRFPLRLFVIKTAKAADRAIIGLAYLFLKDRAIPADTLSDIYVMRDKSFLIGRPVEFDQAFKNSIDNRIKNYETLIGKFKDQNFYVFYIQRILDSKYHPLVHFFPNADAGKALAYFEEKLPDGLILEKLLLSGIEDHEAFSYKTDIHWNIHGVCRAYNLVYKELSSNYPDIPQKLDCENFSSLKGVKFLGFYARTTLFPIKPEIFEVSTAKFPAYQTFISGKESPVTRINEYLVGDFNHNAYASHYGAVFGPQNEPIEYIFEENPPRNLLLIGSSFRKPIEPFIAALYRHTYVIDIRYEEDFSLGEFLKEHQVDDILILGEYKVIYENEEWIINP